MMGERKEATWAANKWAEFKYDSAFSVDRKLLAVKK
jgi:hypothetical protein